MSALRKWALGGLIACVIGCIVFGFVFIKGEMPGSDFFAVIAWVVGIAGVFGIVVKLPDWSNPPAQPRAPPE
jgi:uncharacterized membrane protein HdeD (DUF308 family)